MYEVSPSFDTDVFFSLRIHEAGEAAKRSLKHQKKKEMKINGNSSAL